MNRGLTRRWLAFLVAIVSTMSCRGLGPQGAAVSMPGRALVADTLRLVTLRDTVVVSRTSAWLDPTGDYVISTRLDADTVASLRTRVRFDGSDRPVLIVTAGADVTGQRVEERFWRTPSGASWRNRLEAGDTIGAEASIYVPLDHAKMLIMLPALLSSRGHPLRLLPHGTAWIERERTLTVQRNNGQNTVIQYAIRGLWPDRVWTDERGRLIAYDDVIREGWTEISPELRESARAAEIADEQRYVRTLRRQPNTPVAFLGANLFDPIQKKLVPNTTVVVRGSVIAAVGPDGTVPVPPGSEVVDARGRTILPGLWDMHSHAGGSVSWEILNLAAGVTSIRDILRDTLSAVRQQKRPAEEVTFAPRTFWAGLLEGVGGRGKIHATSDSTARQLVRRYADLGASQIKTYGRLPPTLVPAIVDEAHRRGLRVGGHLAAGMSLEQATFAGYDDISHAPSLTANIHGDSVPMWLRGGFYVARGILNAAELDMAADSVQAIVAMLRAHGIAVDPTLAIIEPSTRVGVNRMAPYIAPVLHRLSPDVGRRWRSYLWPAADSVADLYARGFANLKTLVRLLHQSGVPILPGTDELPGFTLHRELEIYVEAGIPPSEVLALATIGAARTMGVDHALGSIEPGKKADLIIVDGDPVRSISDIRRVVLTMKDGAVYDPAALYRVYAIEPCCHKGTASDTVTRRRQDATPTTRRH